MLKIIHGILLLICFCSCKMKSLLIEPLSLLGLFLKKVLCAFLILVLIALVSSAQSPPPHPQWPLSVSVHLCAAQMKL